MRKEEFNFPSSDEMTEIHSIRWIPEGEIRAILQISHGMSEHIRRYDDFACFLADHGVLVTGNDHLGHGRSVTDEKLRAHFPRNGNKFLLKDIHRLRGITSAKYPGVPYFIMGYSMGSFLVRQYVCMQGEGLAGTILMATGEQKKSALDFAKNLAQLMAIIQKPEHHSLFISAMVFGTYNSRIKDSITPSDWISRDSDQVNKLLTDPLYGGIFTNQAYIEMFKSMIYLKKKKNLAGMPGDLPMLFISGEEDPVGDYGKGVKSAAKRCIEAGIENITCRLYEGARHDILNEINKDEVYSDILTWIESQITSAPVNNSRNQTLE